MDKKKPEKCNPLTIEEYIDMMREVDAQEPKPSEEPEAFFYCKWGGIAWKCSDCKRNHKNSVFRTEDIRNWYEPWHNSSFQHCDGYLPVGCQEISDMINDKIIEIMKIDGKL